MRIGLRLFIIIGMGCHEQKPELVDNGLPKLNSQLATQTDSLEKVKVQVLKYANLYVSDINNKTKEDSMEYWSAVQKALLENIAASKYSIDSLRKQQVK